MQNVCISEFLYAECLYVRMSVCQDVCMSEWRYVWVSGCLYVRIAVCRDVCMPRCLFALNRLKTILSKFSLIFNDVWGCPPPLILTNLPAPYGLTDEAVIGLNLNYRDISSLLNLHPRRSMYIVYFGK